MANPEWTEPEDWEDDICDCDACERCDDRSANAFSDMCSGEPPVSARERQILEWKEKRHG